MKLLILSLVISMSSFAMTCPSTEILTPDEKRFIKYEDKKLRACYVDCDNHSVDAWEMSYCGRDCERNCKSSDHKTKLN